jgi:hypothetical protein
LQTLTARGETTQDLVLHLFRAYMIVTCPVFATYITRKEEEHTADGVEYTPESLMAMVEKYYETLMIRKMWTASTPRDEQVLALTAEIAALKAGRKPGPKVPRDPATNKTPAERFKGAQAWKAVAPKAGEAHVKAVGKVPFHWCPHHGFWTAHKPEECTLAPPVNEPKTSPPSVVTPKMTFAQASSAVIDDNPTAEIKV